MMRQAGVALASTLFAAVPAHAAQIVLAPSNVVGSSGAFDPRFAAGNILDQQTGTINESFAAGYWLNPDGRTPAFITIDLGAAQALGSFELFNSRNLGDRGTANFEIWASNSLQAVTGTGATGFTLGGDTKAITAGTLTMPGSNANIPGALFNSADTSTLYRYIQFRPITATSGSAYGGAAYGLNELRVFDAPIQSAVPEPSTWAFMIVGFGLVGGTLRKRRPVLAQLA